MYRCPDNPEHKFFHSEAEERQRGHAIWSADGDLENFTEKDGSTEATSKILCYECDAVATIEED